MRLTIARYVPEKDPANPSRLYFIERPQQIILVLCNHGAVKQGCEPILCPGRRGERIDFRRDTPEP
jgi:hypothetical protein